MLTPPTSTAQPTPGTPHDEQHSPPVLRQMADSVESEDSMDGYMEYHWEENGTFSCLARYRVGNLNGQGSWLHLKDENLE